MAESKPYALPNRKAFADFITRIFLQYRGKTKEGGDMRELFPHQKLIREYLSIETPYRGLLVYHGLGSGKTCSSIGVAESLLTTKKVFIMLPASLESNYRGEIRKCGDPVYAYDQHWERRLLADANREEAKKIGLSDKFLDRHREFYVSIPGRPPNFNSLGKEARDLVGAQIDDVINQRFSFIRYNGLSSANIGKYIAKDGVNPYDNSVVIIDEVHNFISRIVNASDIASKLYDTLYAAKDCKLVALSGTPVINRPNEIAFLMNLLRGPIERIIIPFPSATSWDEEKMAAELRKLPDMDTIEFNAIKKYIMVTRNPPHFRSVYNEKGERIAVQYVRDMAYVPTASEWVKTWKADFETSVGGGQLELERITTEELKCLPTDFKEFAGTFLDGLNIKNPLLFRRRIQGLVSYFKGADEKVLPRRVDDDKLLEKIPMSDEQFTRYLEVRWQEMKTDSKRGQKVSANDDLATYRVNSRLACNYAVPPDLRGQDMEAVDRTEDTVPTKEDILNKLRANPARYLSDNALKTFAPKMLKIVQNVRGSMGDEGNWRNQFVYSQYRSLEGLGVFSAVLDANGWQPYKLVREAGQWIEDPTMDASKPAYAFYSGEEDLEQREYMRQIFNGVGFSDDFPASLRASVEARGSKLLCLLMGSSASAEGITLANVRHIHIMEPHWNPARHDQVIGRGIRINSHATLPEEERTVRVSFYVSVFTPKQAGSADYPNIVAIRRADSDIKHYEGESVEAFMSTDEYLYEVSYRKDRVNQKIGVLLKESAVDCEIHRKLHSRGEPQLSCMRFDSTTTGEDLAYKPNYATEDADDTYLRNLTKKRRRLQKVQIKQIVFYIDPDTKQVFDGPAFEDNQRLLLVGIQTAPTQIRWVTNTYQPYNTSSA